MASLHIEKTTSYYHQIGYILVPAGYQKKRKTKEYMEKRLGKG
jgi:hypothetical protein